MELVTGTCEAAQAQPLEAVMRLQVCEAHLHALALNALVFILRRATSRASSWTSRAIWCGSFFVPR
jgi:hypothetical protein